MDKVELIIAVCLFSSIVIFIISGWNIFTKTYSRYEDEYLKETESQMSEYFLFIAPEKVLFMKFVFGFISFLIIFFLALSSSFLGKFIIVPIILGSIAGMMGFFIPEKLINYFINKRNETFADQLVDGLTSISNCLKAGLSFGQALEMLVQDMDNPISQEFNLVLKQNRLGKSLEDAMNNMTKRIDNPDLVLVVVSVNIARDIGGNLAEIFDRIATVIRERNVLKKKIDALTAQGKLQGLVVGLMPVVLGLIMYKLQPDAMSLMFTTIWGWMAMVLVVVLEFFGIIIIKKIVNIDI